MSDVRFNQWLHQSGTGGVSQVSGGHVGIGTTNPEASVHSGNNKVLNVGNFNTNIVQLTKKILHLTKMKGVNVYHEKNTIDKRSYEVSTKSSKKIVPNINLVSLTNKSILETFKKVKKDKNPFSNRKITLTVYKEFLKKNKI